MKAISFPAPPPESAAIATLRVEVREFLDQSLKDLPAQERARSWTGFDARFSQQVGARGWLGMTWPSTYGGRERSALERYVVLEEMLAAGAPVAAHWIADRQSGPALLKYGTEEQKRNILPRIASGHCYFCIGMSEPGAGSDLAAVRTRAARVDGGYRISGTKLWTTYAHKSHYMILFCRTGELSERQAGTSQFLVDLKTPGISIRPIVNLGGEHDFNEVHFDEVFLSDSAVIGRIGEGWSQVTSELALERSGPERFLSSYTLLAELVRLGRDASHESTAAIGRLVSHLITLRRLSRAVAGVLHAGGDPSVQAALVKDLGSVFEQEIPEIARLLVATEPDPAGGSFAAVLARTMLAAPGFSLRGGTREILRGIIARGLGLR
jgi:alkylation response protein AidB-like acyl-CoA dehydrogenase